MYYIQSYIKALKYVLSLIRFKQDKISTIQFTDEYYKGLNNEKTELRVFSTKNKKPQSIIIFPGASPDAENHTGMIMLSDALRNAGYNVFLPRIPHLKDLRIIKENIDWVAQAYNEILKHKLVDKKQVLVVGLSYGGANLLKASFNKKIQNNKPKSYLSYGTYFSINTSLNFFLTGKIYYNNETFNVAPHEWGMIVLFYNFLDSIECDYDKKLILKVIKYRIDDQNDKIESTLNNLDDKNKNKILINIILKGKVNNEMKSLVKQIINKNSELLEYLSPENWAHKIKEKVFVIHGANDSMVPFTESTLLADKLPNSKLLISFIYEHNEVSTDRSIFFKIKELMKMITFFADYFRYNK